MAGSATDPWAVSGRPGQHLEGYVPLRGLTWIVLGALALRFMGLGLAVAASTLLHSPVAEAGGSGITVLPRLLGAPLWMVWHWRAAANLDALRRRPDGGPERGWFSPETQALAWTTPFVVSTAYWVPWELYHRSDHRTDLRNQRLALHQDFWYNLWYYAWLGTALGPFYLGPVVVPLEALQLALYARFLWHVTARQERSVAALVQGRAEQAPLASVQAAMSSGVS